MIVCVAPNPAVDKLFQVERLEPGAIHRPDAFVQVPGGKGLNVARAAAALGADVHAVALLGGHNGSWIEAALAREGVGLSSVRTSHETRSCLSVADAETMSLTEFYNDGLPVTGAEWAEFVRCVQELAAASAWTTISGSVPPGVASGYESLAAAGTVAVDTRQLGDARPALLKVNASEASGLTGRAVETHDDAVTAALALRERIGGEGHAAAVTRGLEGAVIADPDGGMWSGSLGVAGPYPVGSGDAFLAGLVVALDRGEGWEGALRLALAAGAANAEQPGAGCLSHDRAEELELHAVVDAFA